MSNVEAIHREFYWVIEDGDLVKMAKLFESHASLHHSHPEGDVRQNPWLYEAVRFGRMDVLRWLIDHGYDINAASNPAGISALTAAIWTEDREQFFEFLLKSGADPNVERPIISAMNSSIPVDKQIWMVTKLIEHGVDVNKLYPLYDDESKSFSALDFASNEPVRELLLLHGAKSSKELKKRVGSPAKSKVKSHAADQDRSPIVIEFFQQKFGPVEDRAIVEVVSDDHPITIHVIKPTKDREVLTLFTTGMSSRPMEYPRNVLGSRHAELYIQLPADWDYLQFKDRQSSWPLVWLRRLAKYPAANDAWLQYPVTIMSEEGGIKMGPKLPFDSFMLFADQEARFDEKNKVDIYRVFPLYPEERELEAKAGVPALLRAFDQFGTSFITDPRRRCAVSG